MFCSGIWNWMVSMFEIVFYVTIKIGMKSQKTSHLALIGIFKEPAIQIVMPLRDWWTEFTAQTFSQSINR